VFWTTRKIADKTGLTHRHVSRLVQRGTIKGELVGHTYLIPQEEAERFIQAREAPELPEQQGESES